MFKTNPTNIIHVAFGDMRQLTPLLQVAIVFVGFACPTTNAAIITTIADETFNPSDWSVTIANQSGGATQQVQQLVTGGNPGAYRRMTHTLPTGSNIGVVHLFLADSYTPSVSGAIISFDYREDQIEFSPPFPGAAIGAVPVLVQDDRLYIGADLTFANLSWQTVQLMGLTSTDFRSGLDQPDFSASGGPIFFGYFRSNTNPAASQYSTDHGIDNWSVTITAVPEPNSGLLTAVAIVGMAAFRRRRQSRHRAE